MTIDLPVTTSILRTCDIFCRVVDNFGDIGVCWRLAEDLAALGMAVRLFTDDASALVWMAPLSAGNTCIAVSPWPTGPVPLAELVIETFGCGLPDAYLRDMVDAKKHRQRHAWINLEYLSAESYVERSHCLASPQSAGAGSGLTSWFFYPGFNPRTGGLLRELDLDARRSAFDIAAQAAWLAAHGIAPQPAERLVSLFCYANPHLPSLLRALGEQPTLLLTTPGHATDQVTQALAAAPADAFGALRTHALPWLSQIDYDHLLWLCDVNFVRGEDSLVRAIWSGKPYVWQIYPQQDGAHAAKLAAYFQTARLDAVGGRQSSEGTEKSAASAAAEVRRAWWRWNQLPLDGASLMSAPMSAPRTAGGTAWAALNSRTTMAAWQAQCTAWQSELADRTDLTTELLEFAAALLLT